jgi:putative hydrolase of the HAD superfamily
MKIKAISFDLWNTIYYDHNVLYSRNQARLNFFSDVLNRNGFNHQLDIEGAMNYCWDYFDKIWREEHRTPDAKELVKLSCGWLGVKLSEEEMNKISRYYEEVILDYPPRLFEGAKDVILELVKKYRLGITSDTAYTPGRVLKQLLERDGMLKSFSAFTFSDETGFSKPDPRAFGSTMSQFGSSPEETVHIGDNEYTDIKGAKDSGMKAVLFKGAYEREEASTSADLKADDWKQLGVLFLD